MYCYEMYEFLFLRDIMTRMQLFVDFIDFFVINLYVILKIFSQRWLLFSTFKMVIYRREHLTILIVYKIWNNIQYLSLESWPLFFVTISGDPVYDTTCFEREGVSPTRSYVLKNVFLVHFFLDNSHYFRLICLIEVSISDMMNVCKTASKIPILNFQHF